MTNLERAKLWIQRNVGTSTDNQLKTLTALLDEVEMERTDVYDLLAVVHRDGGHHTEEVGLAQSCSDAREVFYEFFGLVENLQSEVDQLTDERDELQCMLESGEY